MTALTGSVESLRLVDHPFYQAWQDGTLHGEDLARYAEQYRHFERVLPEVLDEVSAVLPEGEARQLVEQNLHDERHRPCPHVDLFEGFAAAVGSRPDGAPGAAPGTAPGAAPDPATASLTSLYREAASASPVAALAVIGAYEIQASEIAATKSASLRDSYGLDPTATAFWDTHASLEQEHADWTVEALDLLGAGPSLVRYWASRSAGAWWAFLDERQSERVSAC